MVCGCFALDFTIGCWHVLSIVPKFVPTFEAFVLILQLSPGKLVRCCTFAIVFFNNIYQIMRIFFLLLGLLLWYTPASAQTLGTMLDTITTKNQKLDVQKIVPVRHSYAVFFTDSTGKRTSSADIWDREIRRAKNAAGQEIVEFDWKWWRKDSLLLQTYGQCAFPSLELLEYRKEPTLLVKNENGILNVKTQTRTKTDTAFAMPFDGKAFTFPMDLELFGLLPMKSVGQRFSVPFYEPGSGKYSYYTCSVVGKEQLRLQENVGIECWMVQIDYAQFDSYATFWISIFTGEVLKMQEYFNKRYRYKIKLFSDDSADAKRVPKR